MITWSRAVRLAFVTLLLPLTACSDLGCAIGKPRDAETLKLVRGRYVALDDGQPFNGKVESYYSDGKPSAQMCVIDGNINELTTYFRTDGQIAGKGSLVDGEWNGFALSGEEIARGTFKAGKKEGLWLEPDDYDPISSRLKRIDEISIRRYADGEKQYYNFAANVSSDWGLYYFKLHEPENAKELYYSYYRRASPEDPSVKLTPFTIRAYNPQTIEYIAQILCDKQGTGVGELQLGGSGRAGTASDWPSASGSFSENVQRCGREVDDALIDKSVFSIMPDWLKRSLHRNGG
jgi:hypothetical protein